MRKTVGHRVSRLTGEGADMGERVFGNGKAFSRGRQAELSPQGKNTMKADTTGEEHRKLHGQKRDVEQFRVGGYLNRRPGKVQWKKKKGE